MSPLELSAYIRTLCRSGPEVIAAFCMGALLAGMVALTLRRSMHAGRDLIVEAARHRADLSDREAEIARKDAEIAKFEALTAQFRDALSAARDHAHPPHAEPATGRGPDEGAAEIARLTAEVAALRRDLDEARGEAARLRDESDYWARWARYRDDENARLIESGSPSEG